MNVPSGITLHCEHCDAGKCSAQKVGEELEPCFCACHLDAPPRKFHTVTELFGTVISSYTRAEAIADGFLVDLTTFSFRPNLNVCQECGFKFPVAITRAAYNQAIQEDGQELPPLQDLSGRMFDVVNMLRYAVARGGGGDQIRYVVSVVNWQHRNGKRTNATKREDIVLKAVCGPGDRGEPVLTIMLEGED